MGGARKNMSSRPAAAALSTLWSKTMISCLAATVSLALSTLQWLSQRHDGDDGFRLFGSV